MRAEYSPINLGLAYEFGLGIAPDGELADQWYQSAAVQGDSRAQARLDARYEPEGDWMRKGLLFISLADSHEKGARTYEHCQNRLYISLHLPVPLEPGNSISWSG